MLDTGYSLIKSMLYSAVAIPVILFTQRNALDSLFEWLCENWVFCFITYAVLIILAMQFIVSGKKCWIDAHK